MFRELNKEGMSQEEYEAFKKKGHITVVTDREFAEKLRGRKAVDVVRDLTLRGYEVIFEGDEYANL